MKLRKKSGHVVYSPLSYVFQVLKMGGSVMQKYDATSSSFIPNRGATPLILAPSLVISDPDNIVATADYVSSMVNATWTLSLFDGTTTAALPATVGSDTNYAVNATTHRLTLYRNITPEEVLHMSFTADYLDQRRGEVQHFAWECDLGCEAQTDMNVTLDTGRWHRSVLLIPMKHWGQFGIPVQLKNGKDDIPDARCVYQWQWWNETSHTWIEDFSECAWYVSGAQTKEIVVDQDYIQKVILRVRATAFGKSATTQYWTTRMRRWYGQFDYDVEFLQGKYIFHDTDMVALNAWVANSKGQINQPCRFFDIELFLAVGSDEFVSVGYGEEVVVRRSDLQNGSPKAGMLCRELSALRALALDNGKVLSLDDGSDEDALMPLFAQFPTKSREV